MADISCSPPRAPPIQYAAPLGTRWAKETAAAGGVSAFDLPTDPKNIGPWILGECVGKGASGRVKIAKHRVTGQLAAVKILPLAPLVNSRASLATQQAKSDKQRLGIDREITMMKLMNHPNIIRIYDVYEGAKELFLVLEYVQGGELFDFLVNKGRLQAPEALQYFKQIIYGLNYAHTFSIIHRDLKPENILIASLSPPLVKIADWGMAAFAPPSLQLETSCGSPHYASPEIVNGERYQGNATDIWSCGVILYALLTGRLPFDDKNVKTLLAKVKAGKYDIPTWIDPLAADLLSRMLVVDVSCRITIPEILVHPWLLSSTAPLTTDSLLIKTPPLPPSPSTLARPLGHPSLIDQDLFASLRIIWGRHADAQGESIKRDLCSPAGQGIHAKAFYFLLGRHRDESLRTRDGNSNTDDALDQLGSPTFDLGWELDLNKHLQPYALKSRRPTSSHQRATTVVAPISGLAPPIVSRTPSVVSSRDRPPSPVGPRARSTRVPQPNATVQRARSGASRPASSTNTNSAPRLPRRGYTFSVGEDGSRRGRTAKTTPSVDAPTLFSPQLFRRPSGSRSHATNVAPPPPKPIVHSPVAGSELDVHIDLNLDFNLMKLGSEENIARVSVEENVGVEMDTERVPLLASPRMRNAGIQKTIDGVTDRLNNLAKTQTSAPPRAHKGFGDKENQSFTEGWSYVAADEFQLGLGLGANRNDGRKENGNVIFLPDEAKGKREKERKGKHMTMPPLKSKRSTLSILTSPVALNHEGPGPKLTSPGVGEFKGWFSNLFSWKGTGQAIPGTGVIYSADGLDKTRRDVGLLFEKLGITIEGSGFTFAEGSDRGDDDFAMGMMLRCRVEEAAPDGISLKPVRFRVEFSPTPSARALSNIKNLAMPLSPNQNTGNIPSASLNALLSAPLDVPLKHRANVLVNRNGVGATRPVGSQTAILLVHEKGSTSTFRHAWKKLKERYDDTVHPPLRLPPTMSNVSQATTASTSTFVTALVFNAIVFGAEIAIFTILRPHFKAIYEPRTYVPVPSRRIHSLTGVSSIFSWPWAVFKADYKAVLHANGPDAYFFLRFLLMMARVFLPIWIVSWIILLPVTSVKTHVGANTKLDLLSFGNVEPSKQTRYWAHLVLAWAFTFWVFYNIRLEMSHFVTTRQQYLINPVHAKSVQANTILVTGIPARYLSPAALHELFKDLPGGVKRIWINRNLRTLPDIYDRRLAACAKLESAETKLISIATKAHLKAGGDGKDVEQRGGVPEVPRDQRPTHKLGFLGLFGQKVDSIDWARREIILCNRLLKEGRRVMSAEMSDPNQTPFDELDDAFPEDDDADGAEAAEKELTKVKEQNYPALSSAFITFNRQIAANMAKNLLLHHEPYRMAEKYSEVSPQDVIWSNLGLNPYEMRVRTLLSYAATAALIIFWSIPVAFVGLISNLHSLCTTASWLAWICDLPQVVVGILSGILPPVLLAVLMMLLPIVLRLFSVFEGMPKRSGVELSLMTRFFMFQVVHSFLIITLSSGIASALPGLLKDPSSVPSLLAQKLPSASTFFLTYTILQGLSGTAGGFLQIVPLVVYYVKLYLLGSTPRAVYGIKYGARNVAWGTLFPGITLLTVIALVYSVIAPIINGLACFTFFAFFQLYKYLFLWQFEQPRSGDTGGLFFPKAMTHIFVGLYIEQICLAGLFFLARDDQDKASSIPQGALMVALIIITVLYQNLISSSYGPLQAALPLSLADKTFTAQPTSRNSTNSHEMTEPKQSAEAASPVHGDEEQEALTARQKAAAKLKSDDEYGFAHPAASRPQRVIWLPRDQLGLAEEEERVNEAAGVKASLKDAEMNEKGKVDISGPPPDLVLVDE
ncbi:Protein kinase domain-containing protein [Mycena indigotica]|uniref:Protein kinase domain-containing protein n=1 Tax=Mycena indigotica TaxID=2126181 RepID=A0A8H6TGH1_9AGAR|nr:Protein kinase domain-containing protein [Mycena indigotica]KAF7316312.1 Protein kinase domain-containing protein [Mycena indigotica]